MKNPRNSQIFLPQYQGLFKTCAYLYKPLKINCYQYSTHVKSLKLQIACHNQQKTYYDSLHLLLLKIEEPAVATTYLQMLYQGKNIGEIHTGLMYKKYFCIFTKHTNQFFHFYQQAFLLLYFQTLIQTKYCLLCSQLNISYRNLIKG